MFFLISGAVSLWAQTPQYYNSDATASTNAFPFNSTTSNKVQSIYGPNLFNSSGTGVGAPAYYGLITKIYYKISGTVSATATYSNFLIKLSQNQGTNTQWGAAGTMNFNTGMTTVYSASTFQMTGLQSNI